jgi:2-polyprenyl-3-methyl-5-hydroxy-6-metoxy-1,4-benzoquinol methylase
MGDPYLSRPDTFEMMACHRCGLVRTRQLPPDLPLWYEEHYSKAQRIFQGCERKAKTSRAYRTLDRLGVTRLVRKLNVNHHRFVASQVPVTGEILEIGCGAGEILRLLKAKGADVFGIEPHPDSAETARQHGIQVLADRLESLGDFDATFDTILFSFSLEHTEDPVAMLTSARTLLAPHGKLLIFTHNFNCLSRLVFGPSWSGWHLPYHTYLFTADTLGRMLARAGYRVDRVRSYTRPDLLVESFRLALTRLGGAKVATFARKGHLVGRLMCSALTKPFALLGFGNSLKAVASPDVPYSPSPAR